MARVLLLAMVLVGLVAPADEWGRVSDLPDPHGVAGAFAGVSGGALLVAGGANFPDKPVWEGGAKVWTDAVYVLPEPDGHWRVAGKLPRPLGYGVCATYRGSVVCVGGSNADGHYADAFALTWREGRLITKPLPPLPQPVANACGALVGSTLYVAGGIRAPDATEALPRVYRIDLAARRPAWTEADPLPGGGRMLAVAASCRGALYVVGGAELVAGPDGKAVRRYLRDAYRYAPKRGWTRIADLPYPVVAAPSPAPSDGAGFYVLGGDDGTQVGVAHDAHRGFARTVLRYEVETDKWTEAGALPAPRVTTPAVEWRGVWVVPSGEMKPGIRSPEVWRWKHDGRK